MRIHTIDFGKTFIYISCIFSFIYTCILPNVHIGIHIYTYTLSQIFTHIYIQLLLHML